jgi:hypothetical protein
LITVDGTVDEDTCLEYIVSMPPAAAIVGGDWISNTCRLSTASASSGSGPSSAVEAGTGYKIWEKEGATAYFTWAATAPPGFCVVKKEKATEN